MTKSYVPRPEVSSYASVSYHGPMGAPLAVLPQEQPVVSYENLMLEVLALRQLNAHLRGRVSTLEARMRAGGLSP